MQEMITKSVDVLGDAIMATKDSDGIIWSGVSFFCKALGMNKKQKDYQIEKIGKDETLKRGCRKFPAGVFDPGSEAVGMRIDFIPLWLAKINITKTMLTEHPDLADKLLDYQLKAKDILAEAFLPKQDDNVQGQIQLLAKGATELYNRVEGVESEVQTVKQEIETLKDDLPLFPSEADKIKNAVNKRVVALLEGKQSNAYKDIGLRRRVFINCYQNLKSNFDVGKYTEIKRKYRYEALKIVDRYEPPFFLAELIQQENAQQNLDLK